MDTDGNTGNPEIQGTRQPKQKDNSYLDTILCLDGVIVSQFVCKARDPKFKSWFRQELSSLNNILLEGLA